jgi:hypothetical protein
MVKNCNIIESSGQKSAAQELNYLLGFIALNITSKLLYEYGLRLWVFQ